jgi:hypothetical protein
VVRDSRRLRALSDDYVTIAIDTVSYATMFDPSVTVTDSATCQLGTVGNSFSCSYVPVSGVASCPSYRLFTTKGEQYDVLVSSNGYCAGATGEYEIVVDAASDPSLTLAADDLPIYVDTRVRRRSRRSSRTSSGGTRASSSSTAPGRPTTPPIPSTRSRSPGEAK